MNNPISYYQIFLEKYSLETERLSKKMTVLSTLRLLVFIATVFGIYTTFSQWQIALFIGVLGVAIFIYLLSKYTDVKSKWNLNKALVVINEDEIKIASGDFHHRNEGLQFQDSNHFYSLDIDLFGRGSFFQFINRTTINEGTKILSNELTVNNINDIKLRQEAIKELSSKPEWRQHFSAKATLIKVETPAAKIIDWLKNHNPFLPKTMQWLPLAFTIASASLLCNNL